MSFDSGVTENEPRIARGSYVKVWDVAVRIFHWSLVLGMAYEYLFEAGTFAHNAVGQAIIALLVFRIIWGFVGTHYARFSEFITSPIEILRYLGQILKGHPKRFLGHNPAGAAMVLALIFMVAVNAGSGWLMTTDAYWGNELVEDFHKTSVYVTLVLIAGHVFGVLLAGIQHQENLIKAMLSGWKKAE